MKNRHQNQARPQPPRTVKLSAADLASLTPSLDSATRRADRRSAAIEEARKREAEAKQEAARLREELRREQVESVVLLACKGRDVTDLATATRLANVAVNRDAAARSKGQTFDVYGFLSEELSKAKGAPPPPRPAAPRTFQELKSEREAYSAKLRELGLHDPALGAPTGTSGNIA